MTFESKIYFCFVPDAMGEYKSEKERHKSTDSSKNIVFTKISNLHKIQKIIMAARGFFKLDFKK